MRSFLRPGNLLLAACCVAIPLMVGCMRYFIGDPENAQVREDLAGFWTTTEANGDRKLASIEPYDRRTYLIQLYGYRRSGDELERVGGPLVMKAWETEVMGNRFLSLQFMDPRNMNQEKPERYAVVRLKLEGDRLEYRAVKPDFVSSNNVSSNADLERLIAEHLDSEELYMAEKPVYERVKAEQFEDVRAVLELFN
jgi:hypothetical protein